MFWILALAAAVSAPVDPSAAPGPGFLLSQPAVSADGRQVAFAHAGDLWVAPSAGGSARRVTLDPEDEAHPRFSPDGERLAFTSGRSGGGDVYLVELGSGAVRRLTFCDGEDVVESWSPDGRFVYFSSPRQDISGNTDLFRVPVSGGTPTPISRDRYESEYSSSVSPDGHRVAFNVNDRVRQWWRQGPRTSDATEIWIKPTRPADDGYERLTAYAGKDSWPMWAPDGRGLYFVTDEGSPLGAENLAFQSLDGERRLVTSFAEGRISSPDISRRGTIVFERDFRIWLWRQGRPPAPIEIRLDDAEDPAEERAVPLAGGITELALAPDGSRLAFVSRGDVFVTDTADGSAVVRLTWTPRPEQDLAWGPDGSWLVYGSLRDGDLDLFEQNLATRTERKLTSGPESDRRPVVSHDGEWLAWQRGTGEVVVRRRSGGPERVVAGGAILDAGLAWSPRAPVLAFFAPDARWVSNLHVVDARTPAGRAQLSFRPHVFYGSPLWTGDGRSILFSSYLLRNRRRTARIDFPGTGEIGVATRADLERRTETLLDAFPDAMAVAVAPNGGALAFESSQSGAKGLWLARLDSSGERPRLLAAGGSISNVQFRGPEEIWYLDRGRILRRPLAEAEAEEFRVPGEIVVDGRIERAALFREAWTLFRDFFADETFNGLDWEERYRRYLPFALAARTKNELAAVFHLLLGDLDASHVNVWIGDEPEAEGSVDLGLDFDPAALDRGEHRIAELVPGGPVERAGGARYLGWHLVAVDGTTLTSDVNLEKLLVGSSDRDVRLGLARAGEAEPESVLSVRGATPEAVRRLRYEAWVEGNRRLVDELSGGRLGYLHRRHFGSGSVDEIVEQYDSDALAREGMVFDIRYNGGGVESSLAVALLANREVVSSSFRDRLTSGNALIHGAAMIGMPSVLVQNEQCLSDAENFSERYRQLGVGTVVGMPTAAWNRGSRGYSLFDGTRVSVGAWRSIAADGADMDRVPRPVDVEVDRPIGESRTGRDAQLEAAVRILLGELDHARTMPAGASAAGPPKPMTGGLVSGRYRSRKEPADADANRLEPARRRRDPAAGRGDFVRRGRAGHVLRFPGPSPGHGGGAGGAGLGDAGRSGGGVVEPGSHLLG